MATKFLSQLCFWTPCCCLFFRREIEINESSDIRCCSLSSILANAVARIYRTQWGDIILAVILSPGESISELSLVLVPPFLLSISLPIESDPVNNAIILRRMSAKYLARGLSGAPKHFGKLPKEAECKKKICRNGTYQDSN